MTIESWCNACVPNRTFLVEYWMSNLPFSEPFTLLKRIERGCFAAWGAQEREECFCAALILAT